MTLPLLVNGRVLWVSGKQALFTVGVSPVVSGVSLLPASAVAGSTCTLSATILHGVATAVSATVDGATVSLSGVTTGATVGATFVAPAAGTHALVLTVMVAGVAISSAPLSFTTIAASVITGVTLTPGTAAQAAGGTVVSTVGVQSSGPALVNAAVTLTNSAGGDFIFAAPHLSYLPNGVPPGTYQLTFRVAADNAATASFTVSFTVTGAGGFGGGPNVLLRGAGAVAGPTEGAYNLAGGDVMTYQVYVPPPTSGTPDYMLVGNAFNFFIDGTGTLQFYNNAANVGFAGGSAASGGHFQAIVRTGAVTLQSSSDGSTWSTVGSGTWTAPSGDPTAPGTSAYAMQGNAGYTLKVLKNSATVAAVDFTNATVGTNTTIPDAVAGSWVLSGGAQIEAVTPPTITLTPAAIYDNAPIGTQTDTIATTSATGTAILAITNDGGGIFTLSGAAIYTKAALTGTAGQTITGTVTVNDGINTVSHAISHVVGTGINVSSSLFTNTFVSGLHNAMSNGTLGTLTMPGFTNPAVSIGMQDDERQQLYDYYGNWTPRYQVSTSGNVGTVTYGQLSNQTFLLTSDASGNISARPHDTLIFTVQEGAKVAIYNYTNPVAWVPSTLVICVSSAGTMLSTVVNASPNFAPGTTITATECYATMNAAWDAMYGGTNVGTPAATTKYAGCTVILDDQDYSHDFNRNQIGSGTAQQYVPFPTHIISRHATARTLIDFKGQPAYRSQGGIVLNGGGADMIVERIHVANVTNGTPPNNIGNPNAGAFYGNGQIPGNATLYDCFASGSDQGIETGEQPGSHYNLIRFDTRHGGSPSNNTLTHNAYMGKCSSVFVLDCQSLSTTSVHLFKCRARRSTFLGGRFSDGFARGSSCIDLPNGGAALILGTSAHPLTLIKGANPANDGNMVQFNEEADAGANGPTWPNSNLVVDGADIRSLTSAVNDRPTSAVLMLANNRASDGQIPTAVVRNSTFYNIAAANRFLCYSGLGATITDGGGNTNRTTWAPVPFNDRLTGTATVEQVNDFMGPNVAGFNLADLYMPANTSEIVFAGNASAGTVLGTLKAYDGNGAVMTGGTFSLIGAIGPVTISAAGVITNTSSTTADQLCEVHAGYTNTGSPQTWIDQRGNLYPGTTTTDKRIPLIAGTGAVAAR